MEEQMVMGITAGTIVRTILLGIAIINQILSFAGKPLIYIDNEQLSQFVALMFSIVISIVSWWKNNSFTRAARAGDKVMHGIKDGYTVTVDITEEDKDAD